MWLSDSHGPYSMVGWSRVWWKDVGGLGRGVGSGVGYRVVVRVVGRAFICVWDKYGEVEREEWWGEDGCMIGLGRVDMEQC